jgi:hypothetical protein
MIFLFLGGGRGKRYLIRTLSGGRAFGRYAGKIFKAGWHYVYVYSEAYTQ